MDPINTSVMNSRFVALVEEASAILHRTAHTTFVKLVQDYQCALATPEGDMFAYPSQSGVNAFIGSPLHATLDLIGRDTMRPGDVFITNDPYSTDGLVTHLMDLTMLRPIFRDGKLLAVAWAFIHASDIGGAVPGSISPSFTETFQEGTRIRPMRLFDAGDVVPAVKNLLLDNTRIPDELWGDLTAMLTALKSMDRRLGELCDRYGVDTVTSGMEDVLTFSERKARSVVEKIPDGTYSFADYIEGISDDQYAMVHATMTVSGSSVHLDFTGSEPQMSAAYNFVSGKRTHPYLVQALLFYILTVEKDAPRNAGLLRPITTSAPRGTIMNAVPPAAGGSRVASSARISDTIIGCLNQALPDHLMAGGSGMAGVISVSSRDPRTGRNRVSVVNSVCGGSGGRLGSDGVNGVDPRFGHMKSVPAEMTEIETAIRLRSLRLVPDSQAAGKWQGGTALAIEMENKGSDATMVVRGLNRFHFRPWGLRGGAPGTTASVIGNPRSDNETSLGRITVLKMAKGDVVEIVTPAGGGFGNPLERDLDAIARDLTLGLVSKAKAAAEYGVVFAADGSVDAVLTREHRSARQSAPARGQLFDRGPEMSAYRHLWPDASRARLSELVLNEDLSLRQDLLARVRDRLTAKGRPIDVEEVDAEFGNALAELRGGRPHKES